MPMTRRSIVTLAATAPFFATKQMLRGQPAVDDLLRSEIRLSATYFFARSRIAHAKTKRMPRVMRVGVRLLRGRTFNSSDTATPIRVTVINESFAQYLRSDAGGPTGRRIRRGRPGESSPWLEIVGVGRRHEP
jgi:hypothetical protein